MSVSITVLFFGATADLVSRRSLRLDLNEPVTAGEVFERVQRLHPSLEGRKLYLSVNQEYANGTETIRDGDEIGIFTPVSGG